MKRNLLILTLLFSTLLLSSFKHYGEDEISIFDKNGDAKAYIADDLTIYLWDGNPVAYLYKFGSDWHVYGFNGVHLGWYVDGIIYDNNGYTVGAQKDAIIMVTSIEPIKGIKGIKPIKSIKDIASIKPILSRSWGKTSLVIILRAGEN
jgi:hypothetical protein